MEELQSLVTELETLAAQRHDQQQQQERELRTLAAEYAAHSAQEKVRMEELATLVAELETLAAARCRRQAPDTREKASDATVYPKQRKTEQLTTSSKRASHGVEISTKAIPRHSVAHYKCVADLAEARKVEATKRVALQPSWVAVSQLEKISAFAEISSIQLQASRLAPTKPAAGAPLKQAHKRAAILRVKLENLRRVEAANTALAQKAIATSLGLLAAVTIA